MVVVDWELSFKNELWFVFDSSCEDMSSFESFWFEDICNCEFDKSNGVNCVVNKLCVGCGTKFDCCVDGSVNADKFGSCVCCWTEKELKACCVCIFCFCKFDAAAYKKNFNKIFSLKFFLNKFTLFCSSKLFAVIWLVIEDVSNWIGLFSKTEFSFIFKSVFDLAPLDSSCLSSWSFVLKAVSLFNWTDPWFKFKDDGGLNNRLLTGCNDVELILLFNDKFCFEKFVVCGMGRGGWNACDLNFGNSLLSNGLFNNGFELFDVWEFGSLLSSNDGLVWKLRLGGGCSGLKLVAVFVGKFMFGGGLNAAMLGIVNFGGVAPLDNNKFDGWLVPLDNDGGGWK